MEKDQGVEEVVKSLVRGKRVAIVGGGPVGLMTARLLQQQGAKVTVFERDVDSSARISGGTLDIHSETGQKTFEAAGILDRFNQFARPTPERMADHEGNLFRDEEPDLGRPEIDRNDLRQVALESLEPDTVLWDHRFLDLKIEELGEGKKVVKLRFEGKSQEYEADLVIGADGGRSRVRPYVTDSTPVSTGTFAVLGEIPNPEQNCPEFLAFSGKGNLIAVGAHRMTFTQTKRDGSLAFFLSLRSDSSPEHERWVSELQSMRFPTAAAAPNEVSLDVLKKKLQEVLSDWNPVYRQAIDAVQEFASLTLHTLPLWPSRKVETPITLVGDAAHLMPPFAGVGVNIGLQDALELSEAFKKTQEHESIEAAIESYENAMRVYAAKAQQRSCSAEKTIHSGKTIKQIFESMPHPPGLPPAAETEAKAEES